MNLISQAFSGLITWTEAEAKIIAAQAALVAQGVAAVAVTKVKQLVSDAIGQADSFLAANYANIAKATETGLEAELAVLTRGLSAPLNPIMSKGIDDMAAAAAAAAHAWALTAKAALAVPTEQAAYEAQARARQINSGNDPSMGSAVINMPGAAGQSTTMNDSRD